jgi:predicted amidohydrolase YtcJ
MAIGSDGPFNPFLNIHFAVLHPDNPPEALGLDAALIAYTHGSAFAEHADDEKGRLAPGMLADLAVLSQDIFAVPVTAIPATRSVLTVVGGTMVYDAGLLRPTS